MIPKPIRVLHLNSSAVWRGGEQQVIYLTEELRKLGIDSIVGCKGESALELYCKENKLPYFSLPFLWGFDLPTSIKIKKICERERIDLLHIHTGKAHTLAVLAGLMGLKVKMILARRVDLPINNNVFSRYKYNYRQIKKVICVSQAILKTTGKDIRDKNKLIIVHDGINTSKFLKSVPSLRSMYPNLHSKFFIGNVSALADPKDYFTFIDTAEILLKKRNDLHFFIIGDGPLRKNIENYIQSKRLDDFITLTGFLSNIPDVLPDLDIFLFTSKSEGLGTTVLDAFSAGVPVIATQAGGIPELITNEVNGMLSSVGDANSLASNTLRVVEEQDLRERLIFNARKRVLSFSKELTAQHTLEVYQAMMDNQHKTS